MRLEDLVSGTPSSGRRIVNAGAIPVAQSFSRLAHGGISAERRIVDRITAIFCLVESFGGGGLMLAIPSATWDQVSSPSA
jgi:hypothetical protein